MSKSKNRDHVAVATNPDHPYRSTCVICGGDIVRQNFYFARRGRIWRHAGWGNRWARPIE